MTATQTAGELYEAFMSEVQDNGKAVVCALIAASVIINELDSIYTRETEGRKAFWYEVKVELNKL